MLEPGALELADQSRERRDRTQDISLATAAQPTRSSNGAA